MGEVPETDLREVYREAYTPEEVDDTYIPEYDVRWLENHNGQPYPWTFDEVPPIQRLKCRLGFHKGRIEVLGGEPCFYCSYCGEHIR